MATQGRRAKPKPQNRVGYDYPIPPPVSVAVVRNRRIGEEIVGWVAACFLIVLLLPLMGMLYFDILETKHEAKHEIEKVEKLRKEIEKAKNESH